MIRNRYDRVLAINLGGLGDLVTVMPVLAALKRAGTREIVSLVWPAQEGFAAMIPSIDRLAPLPRAWENDPELTEFTRALAGPDGFDLVLDFGFMPRAGIITAAAGGRRTVGFALDPDDYPWYTDIYPNAPGELRVERNLRLIERLGLPRPAAPDFSVDVSGHAVRRVDRLLAANGIGALDPPVVIHPGSGRGDRNWPADRFAALADLLARNTGEPVVLLGGAERTYDGRDERTLTARVASMMETPALDLAGRLDLPELVALLRRCALFVGNNSGPAHIAATIAGAPCLLAWAPRNETVWRPWGDSVTVVTAEPECAVDCRMNRCDSIADCMELITVDDMYYAWLDRQQAGPVRMAAGGSG